MGLMRVGAFRHLRVCGAVCGLIILAWVYCGPSRRTFASESERAGLPWDWSHEHVVFSDTTDPEISAIIEKDPRLLHQRLRRNRSLSQQMADDIPGPRPGNWPLPSRTIHKMKRDWGASLGATLFNSVNSNTPPVFPAKFTWDINQAPSCANDYAAFPTGNMGKTSTNAVTPNGQASIVGFKNLYSTQPSPGGLCNTDGPTVAWSYINAACPATITSDSISSSPVISYNGKKVAWVTNKGVVQVLTIGTGGGSALAPLCIGADGSTLQSGQLGNAKHNPVSGVTLSEIYVDYNTDSAYVADDDGYLHKISPFFTTSGTLQEMTTPAWQALHMYSVGNLIVDSNGFIEKCTGSIFLGISGFFQPSWNTTWGATTTDAFVTWTNEGAGGGWPVFVTGSSTHVDNSMLSGPVFDIVSKNIFVGDMHGSLFYVLDPGTSIPVGSCANGATLYPCLGLPGTTTGIATGIGPQMDCSTASPGPTCLVMSNQVGFTDPVIVDSSNSLVITQFANADSTNATVEQTNHSLSVFNPPSLAPHANLSSHIGTFDNNYFSNPTTGYYYVCSPDSTGEMTNLYRIGFVNNSGTIALGSENGTPFQITTTDNTGNCSPLTEIYNPATAKDWLFLSVDNHGVTATCNNQSCVMSFILGSSMVSAVNASYVPSANMNGTGGIV